MESYIVIGERYDPIDSESAFDTKWGLRTDPSILVERAPGCGSTPDGADDYYAQIDHLLENNKDAYPLKMRVLEHRSYETTVLVKGIIVSASFPGSCEAQVISPKKIKEATEKYISIEKREPSMIHISY